MANTEPDAAPMSSSSHAPTITLPEWIATAWPNSLSWALCGASIRTSTLHALPSRSKM